MDLEIDDVDNLWTYRSVCMPDYKDAAEIIRPEFDMTKRIFNQRKHLLGMDGHCSTGMTMNEFGTRPMVFTVSKGCYPDLPTDKDKFVGDPQGPKELYMHVYGRFDTYYLDLQNEFQDINNVMNTTHDYNIYDLLKTGARTAMVREAFAGANIHGWLGTKLVYKRPPQSSAGGCRFMVKVYIAGQKTASAYQIKNTLNATSNRFRKKVYNSCVQTYTDFLVAKNAGPIGEMRIKKGVNPGVKKGAKYDYVDVHYRDIEFSNYDTFVLSEIDGVGEDLINLATSILNNHRNNFDILTKTFIKSRLKSLAPIIGGLIGSPNDFTKFKKKMVMYIMTKEFKNCMEYYLTELRSKGIQLYHALGIKSEDVKEEYVRTFCVNMLRYQYLLVMSLKEFWVEKVRGKLYSAVMAKEKEMLTQKIGMQLRTMCFDIETNFVPHSDAEQQVTLIHCVLYDEGAHNCPIEQRTFHYKAEERSMESLKTDLTYDKVVELCKKQVRDGYDLKMKEWLTRTVEQTGMFKSKKILSLFFEKMMTESKIKIHPDSHDYDADNSEPKSVEECLAFCKKRIIEVFDICMEPGKNYFIYNFKTEKEMLLAFLKYVRDSNLTVLTHYNGDSFDLPFVINRCEKLKIDGMKEYTPATFSDGSTETKRRRFQLKLTHRHDILTIKYKKSGKVADSTHKKNAINSYLESKREKLFQADDDDDDDDEDEDDGLLDERQQDSAEDMKKKGPNVYRPMAEARNIFTLQSNFVASRDVMKMVPDQAPNVDDKILKDKTLNSSAFSFLGIRKIDHEAVSYANLCKTWKFGDLNIFVAYCAVDTLLTMKIDQTLKTGMNAVATASNVYLPIRELYGNQALVRTLAIMYSYQWYKNICSPDPSVFKNEDRFWNPEYVWKDDDFKDLKPRAGRTISNVSGVYNSFFSVLFDFNSQYPGVMISENVCVSTLLDKEDADKMSKDDYVEMTIPNVYPKVRHACEPGSEKCGMNLEVVKKKKDYGLKCKWTQEFVMCEHIAKFAKKSVMEGIAGECCKNLLAKRKHYKKLMAEAAKAGNHTEVVIYNQLQLVMKVNANSIFGILLLLDSVTGGAITHEARMQNERGSEYLKKVSGPMAMADTDSTAPIAENLPLDWQPGDDKDDVGPLNRLCRRLFPGRKRPKISEFVHKIDTMYESYGSYLNDGVPEKGIPPAWIKPANLEIEKMFIGLVFIKKKNYYALKMLPGGELATHVAGLACMKSDKTKIKGATQLVLLKMLVEGDYEGYIRYATDLFSLMVVTLRAEEASKSAVKMAVENGQLEGLDELEEKTKRDFGYRDLIPKVYYTSREKVNSIENPKTVADKMEQLRCKRYGIDFSIAATVTDVVRGIKPQVGAPLTAINNTILIREPTEEQKTIEREMDMRWMARSFRQQTREDNRLSDKKEKIKKKNAEVKPLDITDMPDRLKVDQQVHTTPFPTRIRLGVKKLNNMIDYSEKAITKERDSDFVKELFHQPELMADEEELQRATEQVVEMIENFKSFSLHFPLFWYDERYCISNILELEDLDEVWHTLPNDESCVDLWNMYKNLEYEPRYIAVKVGKMGERLQMAFFDSVEESWMEYKCTNCYIFKENVWSLDDKNLAGKIYYMDMQEYEKQTRTTPLIITSPDKKKRYLVNRGSYVRNKNNAFSFKIKNETLMNAMSQTGDVGDKYLTFKPIYGKAGVCIIGSKSAGMCKSTFIRDDGREMPATWPYKRLNNQGIKIPRQKILKIMNDSLEIRNIHNNHNLEFSFDSKTENLTIRVETAFDEKRIKFYDESKQEKLEIDIGTNGQTQLGSFYTSVRIENKVEKKPKEVLPEKKQSTLSHFVGMSSAPKFTQDDVVKKKRAPKRAAIDRKSGSGGKKSKITAGKTAGTMF